MEREKTALLMRLQESQTQLQHTQGALSEQNERVHRLTEHVNTMKCLNGDKELVDPQESEKVHAASSSPPADGHHELDVGGFEILECKYKVAVTEVIDLKAELKALKEKYNQAVEGQGENHDDDRAQALSEQVCVDFTIHPTIIVVCQLSGKEVTFIHTHSFICYPRKDCFFTEYRGSQLWNLLIRLKSPVPIFKNMN